MSQIFSMAVLISTKLIDPTTTSCSTIRNCVNNQPALKMQRAIRTLKWFNALILLGHKNSIELHWVPGHNDILGSLFNQRRSLSRYVSSAENATPYPYVCWARPRGCKVIKRIWPIFNTKKPQVLSERPAKKAEIGLASALDTVF